MGIKVNTVVNFCSVMVDGMTMIAQELCHISAKDQVSPLLLKHNDI